jgi:Uma2 family endonuclease
MNAVTLLPRGRPLTRDDLERMPDDGHRYELIDGTLVVTPAPSPRHQTVVAGLHLVLAQACPSHLRVLFAPLDVVLAVDTVVEPDLLVARKSDFTQRDLPVAPLLAVEVLSPSTRLFDLNLKRARYERAGCPSYWVVDLDPPSMRVWQLADGEYDEVAFVKGAEPFAAASPFAVNVVPDALLD